MPYLLFDVAIVLILLFFLWRGASKGFVLSLCGLVAVIVALVGASFLAGVLAPRVGAALEPRFAAAIEEQLNAAIQSGAAGEGALAPEDVPLSGVLDVLRDMGLYEDLVESIDQAVSQGLTGAAASAAAAVAAAIAQSAAYAILFLIFFLLVLIAWTILSHALDLVSKLPGLNALNKLGGAAFGFLKGCIFLFVAAWLLRFSGSLIPEEAVQQTTLLRFFMTTNPMTLLAGL